MVPGLPGHRPWDWDSKTTKKGVNVSLTAEAEQFDQMNTSSVPDSVTA